MKRQVLWAICLALLPIHRAAVVHADAPVAGTTAIPAGASSARPADLATRPADAAATRPADARWGDLPHTNTVFKPARYETLDTWRERRAWLRDQVRVAAGLWPEPERTPLNAKIFGRIEGDGYTIEKVYFESYPGFYVTGNLYRPSKIEGKLPAVACPHGHWSNGRLEQTDTGNIPARCITLARLGAVVFAYDMVGYNDSKRQIDHRINTPQRDLWGITSLHLQTWNSIRVLDFLQALPEVDPQRIGVTGASGGGTQTFILSAIDDRVKVAAPVNMISSTMQGGCICENAPCLRIDTNNMEIGALMAPKPLLMISATGDWTKLTPEVEYPFIRSIYALYDAADKVKSVHIDAPHNYNQASREAMYRFFAKHLLNRPDAETITEGDIPQYTPEQLLVWTAETAPKDMLTIDQLTQQIQRRLQRKAEGSKPVDAQAYNRLDKLVRTWLQHSVGSNFPSKPGDWGMSGMTLGLKPSYRRQGRSVQADAWRSGFPPERRIIRSVPAQGSKTNPLGEMFSAKPERAVEVLCVTAFPGTEKPKESTPARESTGFFTTFNRVNPAEAAFDLITVLAFEWGRLDGTTVGLMGTGEAGPQCLIARALMPADLAKSSGLRTVIDMNRFEMHNDEAYLKALNLPHIRRIGGLRAIAAVACNGPIWFHNIGEPFDEEWVNAAGRVNGVEVRVSREKADETAIAEWLMKAR
ncbi:MAG: hypothetical protein AMXMBFR13_37470 [Phycisphaerae bacterium]